MVSSHLYSNSNSVDKVIRHTKCRRSELGAGTWFCLASGESGPLCLAFFLSPLQTRSGFAAMRVASLGESLSARLRTRLLGSGRVISVGNSPRQNRVEHVLKLGF